MKNEKLILIDDMEVYKMGMEIGDEVWKFVDKWDQWKKDTIGKQLVKAADSIAANFSEGYGRYTFKDRKNFCYISRGSMFETRTWLTKARNRNIISTKIFDLFIEKLRTLHHKLNGYIASLNKSLRSEK
jgi:four helix bundle protein